ncbi:MAG: hypothetical protein JWO74_4394 [Solirubrobacterales bacterium]|nr:hypothetical protein [Solirubrobacterales bacterium]
MVILTPFDSARSERLSFFDEGDEPTRVSRPARPRRPATRSHASGGPPDRQTLLVRQAVLLGVGLILIILIVLGVNGCLNNRKASALKDYNRNVTAIISDSDDRVMKPLFELLATGASQGNDLQVQVNQLRLAADEDAKRARGLSAPGDVQNAQRYLEQVLDFRAEGLRRIADRIPTALGTGEPARLATNQIAGEMQIFLTSDVVYSQRTAPLIKQGLDAAGIHGQTISTSSSLRDLAWLSPAVVASRLGSGAAGASGGGSAVKPGAHGHGLTSVAVGATTLQPGSVVNRIPAGPVTFTVKFANQGDNDETNVHINITVKGGPKDIVVRKTVPQTKAKTTSTVDIPLGQAPPVGAAVTVTVAVAKVPGEKNTTNNSQDYTVLFQ